MAGRGALADDGAALRLPDHAVRFTPTAGTAGGAGAGGDGRAALHAALSADLERDLGADVLQALLDQGGCSRSARMSLFLPAAYQEMVERVIAEIRAKGATNVASVRDTFSTSRRYAIALLEHLDETRVTRRQGDDRVLK